MPDGDYLLEYWTSNEAPLCLPPGQGDVRRKWRGAILLVDDQGVCSEFALKVDRKVRLSDFIGIVSNQLTV
ncbi:MAG: hypothetical protein GYB33_09600 [Gammaproteobacteria bacterium]|nr:hypothetical protein [Gammaproteobacteria bacterium]